MKDILAVIVREIKIWRRRPLYFVGTVIVLIVCTVFYTTLFRDGIPDKLPIGVVDYDNSTLTRNMIRQLDATQLGHLIPYPDFKSARADMEKGKITSVCVMPAGMMADVQAQRRPTFTFYINNLYFLGGSLAYKDLMYMSNLMSGAVQREVLRMKGVNEEAIMGRIQPIQIDTHQIGNPMMSYGPYLVNMMLPGMLQMIVIIVMIYALGSELKFGTSRQLLKTSGGSITKAVAGKCLLYTAVFTMMGFAMLMLLYGPLHYYMAGHLGNMFLAMFLMILADEAIALLIISLVPVLRLGLSVGSLYTVMALSLTGFTLPIEAMPPFVQYCACIFPLRHYFQFFVQEGVYNNGFAGWYPEVIHLMVFLLLPAVLLPRLKEAYETQMYPRK